MRRREILSGVLVFTTLCSLVMADKAVRQQRRAEKKAKAEKAAPDSSKYIRLLKDDDDRPTALQTSVVRFEANKKSSVAAGTTVDLIGAVHIGDRRYYKSLNKLFEEYDVLLFELVAPPGTVPTPAARAKSGGNPISMMQSMTRDMLNLESQLTLIDYTKKNFVHADMSPEQMAERMRERGDTGFTVALSAAAEIMRQANLQANDGKSSRLEEMNPIEMLLSFRDAGKMKRLMAEQFVETGALDAGLGETLSRMIVSDRNEAAMKVLEKELGKGHKKIGIFYGAAHMPDFEKRLVTQHKLKVRPPTWITAWDLTATANPRKKAEDPLDALLNLLGDLE